MTDDIRSIAESVEAVKIALTQDKNGFVLKLSIHPNDISEALLKDIVGTRYTVAFVRMNDQGEPVADPGTEEGLRALKLSQVLCKDDEFQSWMVTVGLADELGEESSVEGLRKYLGIASRSELKLANNHEKRKKLKDLRDEFAASFRRPQGR